MKALVSLVLAIALIGGVYVATTTGCQAQREVASDKMMEKINGWLGEVDVKRKEIEIQIENLDKAIAKNREGKINFEVRLEQLDAKIAPVKNDIDRIKKAMAEINPHLGSTEDVELFGKTQTPDELNTLADELLQRHELLSSQMGAMMATKKTYEQAHNVLKKEYETSSTQMASLKQMLEQIDIKKKALDDMKVAQEILGESGSISDKFTTLEEEINDLFVDVESGIRLETEKITQREAAQASGSTALDELLGEVETAEARKARFDAILGTSGEGGE